MSSVAETIYDQLGGRPAFYMMGARDIVKSEKSLRWRVPRGHRAIAFVEIKYDKGMDNYEIFTYRYNRMALRVVEHRIHIGVEMLARTVETMTQRRLML